MAIVFTGDDYVPGTRYIFDLFTSRMAGRFVFSSNPQVDYENFPMLEQPIFIWVPGAYPYATKLNPRLSNFYAYVAAVKVSVNEVPKPLKPYNSPQEPVIFWNWPDSTPTSFSAFILRCSPLILPQITTRDYSMIGRGYLLDEASHPVMASDKSNYLGLLGPHFNFDNITNIPIAFLVPLERPVAVDSQFLQYLHEKPVAAQFLDAYSKVPPIGPSWGEAAPTIGYWMAFLPVSCNKEKFEACVRWGGLCYEEE